MDGDSSDHRCKVCGTRTRSVCDACRAAWYCCHECQRADWDAGHRMTCGNADRTNSAAACGSGYDDLPAAVLADIELGDFSDYDHIDGDDACGVEFKETRIVCMKSPDRNGATRKIPLVRYDGIALSEYPEMRQLGKGSFGVVTERSTADGPIAMKIMELSKLPETMGEVRVATIHETELRDLDHPNIVGTCKMGFAAGRRGEQPTHVAMMMDVIARSGTDFMKSKKRVEQALTPEEFKCIAYQLIRAIAFCHSRYVANYDIKPGNVLIGGMRRSGAGDEPGSVLPRVWLSDFGLSGGYEFGARAVPRRGTSQYQPPEWIFMDARDESIEMIGTAVDAWGLACTLYALATGHSLFTGKAGRGSYSVSAHRSQIVSLIGPVPEELKETWYAKYGSMSIGNPAKEADSFRVRVADALEKLGYTPGLADMLRRMLDWNPETRLRPSQIIKSPEDFPFFDEKTIDTILQAIPPGTREMELEDYASQTITGEPAADDVLAFLKLREMQREKYVKFAEPQKISKAFRTATYYMLQLFGKGAVTNPTTACAALGILAAYANATQKKKKNITELPPTAPDFRCRMAALACLRLAIKYRENQHPDPATVFARMLGPKCTAQRLMLEERAVLVALDFGPALPTAYDSFTQLARKNDIDADKASDVRANVGVAVAVALAVAPDIIKAYLPSEMAEFCIRAALRGDSAVSTESKTDATARSALRVAYNSIAFRNAMFGLMRLSGAAVRKSMWDSIRKTFKQIIEHGF